MGGLDAAVRERSVWQIGMEIWHGNFCSFCLEVPGSDSW